MKVLIMTPVDVEFAAVTQHLTNTQRVIEKDAFYQKGNFKGATRTYEVLVRQPGAKNATMTAATERAIEYFQPDIALIIGIAAGIKDVTIGDVVIATKVYGYESGKETDQGFMARPEVANFSTHLTAWAQAISKENQWKNKCTIDPASSKVKLGPIAAGDKLMANTDNEAFKRLLRHCNDAIALDMESVGFAQALEGRRQIHGIVVRGISDLCVNKSATDAEGGQEMAIDHAAAFAFQLLYEIDQPFNNPTPHILPVLSGAIPPKAKSDIRELVSRDRLNEALQILIEYKQEADLLRQRLAGCERDNTLGLITDSNYRTTRTKIASGILKLLG